MKAKCTKNQKENYKLKISILNLYFVIKNKKLQITNTKIVITFAIIF